MTAETQALIRRAIADPGAVVAARRPEETGPAWSARAVEQTLLDAGWRPPLPKQTEGQSPWDAYVAAYREYQETDPHGATAHPTAHHMHALEAALRVVAGSPLPDSETEWGYRVPWGVDVAQPSEAAARQLVDGSLPGARVLVRREVGPWTEVQP